MSATAETSHAAGNDAGVRMDGIYRYQRHVYDLSRKYYLLGRDHLIDRLAPPPGGSVLELGCGTGRNLIAVARAYPDARIFGLDVSAAMLATARRNLERTGASERIALARGDAAAFDPAALFGEAAFDRVFFSYALSMIPPWRQALQAGLGVLRDGGILHVVDFGQQERLPALFKAVLFGWLRRFHVEPRHDLEEACVEAGGVAGFASLYRGYAWYAAVER